jgi:hypothetical protein
VEEGSDMVKPLMDRPIDRARFPGTAILPEIAKESTVEGAAVGRRVRLHRMQFAWRPNFIIYGRCLQEMLKNIRPGSNYACIPASNTNIPMASVPFVIANIIQVPSSKFLLNTPEHHPLLQKLQK